MNHLLLTGAAISAGLLAFTVPKVLRGNAWRTDGPLPPAGAWIETRGNQAANHAGLYVGDSHGVPRAVLHCRKWGHVILDPLERFAPSGRYWVREIPAPGQTAAVVARGMQRLGYPYSLLDHNCEHTVSRAYGLRGSPQAQEAALIAVIVGGLYLLAGSLSAGQSG